VTPKSIDANDAGNRLAGHFRLANPGQFSRVPKTTDDLENREISAAEIHGIYPKWAYGSGGGRGVEEAF